MSKESKQNAKIGKDYLKTSRDYAKEAKEYFRRAGDRDAEKQAEQVEELADDCVKEVEKKLGNG